MYRDIPRTGVHDQANPNPTFGTMLLDSHHHGLAKAVVSVSAQLPPLDPTSSQSFNTSKVLQKCIIKALDLPADPRSKHSHLSFAFQSAGLDAGGNRGPRRVVFLPTWHAQHCIHLADQAETVQLCRVILLVPVRCPNPTAATVHCQSTNYSARASWSVEAAPASPSPPLQKPLLYAPGTRRGEKTG